MEVSNVSMVVIGYAVYLPVAIFLTYLVAKTLFKNGKVFMLDIFRGREEIANSTNKLFQMGFYLLNIGFALLILKIYLPFIQIYLQPTLDQFLYL